MLTGASRQVVTTGLVVVSLAIALTGCGSSSSPAAPTPTPTPAPAPAPAPAPTPAALASLSVSPASNAGGAVPAATVTLAAAVSADTTVSLSSSNASAASVPSTVVVPAGQTSARVNVTTSPVAANTPVTITATLGSATQTATVTVMAGTLVGLTIEPSSVRSQGEAVGTVTLSAPAPPGGATVSLESSNLDIVKVPSSVVVAAGQIRNTFVVASTTIRFPTPATIEARYAGVGLKATITVGPPELTAVFSVTSDSRGADICVIVATGAGGTRMDCVLDAKESRGFPSRYRWTMRNGDKSVSWQSSDSNTRPAVDCSVLDGGTLSNGSFQIVFELIVTNEEVGQSGITSKSAQFFPEGRCSY